MALGSVRPDTGLGERRTVPAPRAGRGPWRAARRRRRGSTATAGQSTGTQTLAAIGDGVLTDPTVSVTRTATEVRVEVAGVAQTVVPGVRWTARAVVVRPVERFVPDTQGEP
jgi:hypothetical protein